MRNPYCLEDRGAARIEHSSFSVSYDSVLRLQIFSKDNLC